MREGIKEIATLVALEAALAAKEHIESKLGVGHWLKTRE